MDRMTPVQNLARNCRTTLLLTFVKKAVQALAAFDCGRKTRRTISVRMTDRTRNRSIHLTGCAASHGQTVIARSMRSKSFRAPTSHQGYDPAVIGVKSASGLIVALRSDV